MVPIEIGITTSLADASCSKTMTSTVWNSASIWYRFKRFLFLAVASLSMRCTSISLYSGGITSVSVMVWRLTRTTFC